MYMLVDQDDNSIPFLNYDEAINAMCLHNAMNENNLWNIIEVVHEDDVS